MKIIPLTRGYVAVVDDADYERVMAAGPWFAMIRPKTVYAVRNVPTGADKSSRLLHRFILGLTDRTQQADHRNGHGMDNRRANLRSCTSSQNNTNRGKAKGTSSKYIGVTRTKQGWMAQKKSNGRTIYLGVYADEKTAALVYDAVSRQVAGEFARCNFPLKGKQK